MIQRREYQGFTLIELVISMAVGFSSLHLAIVSGESLLSNNRLTITANTIIHDLYVARSSAIMENKRIVVRKTADEWGQGWIVFEDSNNNATLDSNERLLQQRQALSRGLTLRGNRPVKDYISYTGRGLSRKTSGSLQAGTLLLCDKTLESTPEHARAIIIASSGRPRVTKKNKDLRSRTCK
jgi:type IV fimbrial biogenesis protein FimT